MDFRNYVKFRELCDAKTLEKSIKKLESKMDAYLVEHFLKQDEQFFSNRVSGIILFENNLALSVFGGLHAYSLPKKDLNIFEYIELEIAMYFTTNNNLERFINVLDEDFFKEYKRKRELYEYWDNSVYSYVPIELIQSLFDYINKDYPVCS